jgi:hypothetical protein
MLYRHSRAASLESTGKEIIRKFAASVVDDNHFTPERIKRFVSERLPALAEQRKHGTVSDEVLAEAVKDAIENPTDRMRKAFAKLGNPKVAPYRPAGHGANGHPHRVGNLIPPLF